MIALARPFAVHRQQEHAGRVLGWGELIHYLDLHGRFPVSPVERGDVLRNMHTDLEAFHTFHYERAGNTYDVVRDAAQTDANILVDSIIANDQDADVDSLAIRREIIYVSVPIVREGFEVDCASLLGNTAGHLPERPLASPDELARRLADPRGDIVLCHDALLCITVRLCTPWMQSSDTAPKLWRRGAVVHGRIDPDTPIIPGLADRGVELMLDVRRFSARIIPLVSTTLRNQASALAEHLVEQFSS